MDETYPLKHYLLTLVISSFLTFIYAVYSYDIILGFFLAIHGTFFSFFFSLPALLVYLLLFYALKKLNIAPVYVKSILIIITLVGIITFQLIQGSAIETLTYIYGAVSLLVGSILNIKKEESISKKE